MTLLQGTSTGGKNEILWHHEINYQTLPEQFKKVTGHLPLHFANHLPLSSCHFCVPEQGGSMHDEDYDDGLM